RAAVARRVIHVAQRVARGARGPDVLTHVPGPVGDVAAPRVGVGAVDGQSRAADAEGLADAAEHVRIGLVHAAGLSGVVQAGGALGDGVGQLVGRHVHGPRQVDGGGAVAVAVHHL